MPELNDDLDDIGRAAVAWLTQQGAAWAIVWLTFAIIAAWK